MKLTARSFRLYSADQAYALDRVAIAAGVSGIRLMKRAARAALAVITSRFTAVAAVTIYVGGGNNGGDGYVLAGLLAQRKIPVTVIALISSEQLVGDALEAHAFAVQEGVTITAFDETVIPSEGIIVDALMGIGFTGELRNNFGYAIAQINAANLPVIALDIPSGLNASTGDAGLAVKATVTVTFLGVKVGLVTGRGPALAGHIILDELEIAPAILDSVECIAEAINLGKLLAELPVREVDAHKGDFGRVLVVGGDIGFGGAALMAAEAAARVGAGLVSIATRPEHVPAILARRPEVMATGVVSGQELEPWLERPSHIIVGPGLGRSPWSEQMLQQAVKSQKFLVLDADALNILAESRVVKHPQGASRWLLTPHPAEAARLLGTTTAEVQANRIKAATALAERYQAAVILKGAGSVVVVEGKTWIVLEGNPGMATGGMGDVLSGVLGGLWAQGFDLDVVATLGASLHSAAGDLAAEEWGQRSLLAIDVIPYVCELLASAEV